MNSIVTVHSHTTLQQTKYLFYYYRYLNATSNIYTQIQDGGQLKLFVIATISSYILKVFFPIETNRPWAKIISFCGTHVETLGFRFRGMYIATRKSPQAKKRPNIESDCDYLLLNCLQ